MITNLKLYKMFIASAEVLYALDVVNATKIAGLRCSDGCPGWAVFNPDTDPSIQRCDACAHFTDDDAALRHVLARVFLTNPNPSCVSSGRASCNVCRLRAAGMEPETVEEAQRRDHARALAKHPSLKENPMVDLMPNNPQIIDVPGQKHGVRVTAGTDDSGAPYVTITGGGENPELSVHLNDLQLYEGRPEQQLVTCAKCKGKNVQVEAWVDPNTGTVVDSLDSDSADGTWCADCHDNDHGGHQLLKWETS